VDLRILGTDIWALVPDQPDPGKHLTWQAFKAKGAQAWLADRVSAKLRTDVSDVETSHSSACTTYLSARWPDSTQACASVRNSPWHRSSAGNSMRPRRSVKRLPVYVMLNVTSSKGTT
jgi:hypothetical protein